MEFSRNSLALIEEALRHEIDRFSGKGAALAPEQSAKLRRLDSLHDDVLELLLRY